MTLSVATASRFKCRILLRDGNRVGARWSGWILVAALLLLIGVATGCSAGGALVGEWHVDGAGQKMVQFSNDGRFESTCLGIPAGTYQVTNDGKAVEFRSKGTSETLMCSVSGGTMSLSGSLSDGTQVRWAMTRAASRVRAVR